MEKSPGLAVGGGNGSGTDLSDSALKRWLLPAGQALRLYWPAILLMQACALGLALGYYQSESVREFAQGIVYWREAGGMLFAALANIVSGGVLPELLKWRLRPKGMPGPSGLELMHQFALFGILGVSVDLFYQAQAVMFGSGSEWWRLAVKILVDQFVFTPLFAIPVVIFWFFWREQEFSLRLAMARMRWSVFAERFPAIMVPNVLFWMPCLVGLYTLPTALQLPLFLILNTAWCVILVFIARRQTEKRAAVPS